MIAAWDFHPPRGTRNTQKRGASRSSTFNVLNLLVELTLPTRKGRAQRAKSALVRFLFRNQKCVKELSHLLRMVIADT